MDEWTKRHFITWLSREFGSRPRAHAAITEAMVQVYKDNPTYWKDKGWTALALAVNAYYISVTQQ